MQPPSLGGIHEVSCHKRQLSKQAQNMLQNFCPGFFIANLYLPCPRPLPLYCSVRAVRRCPGRQRGRLHHFPRLSSGVPASPELSLGHHGAGALAAHRPQLQPPLRDREAGLQVRWGEGQNGRRLGPDMAQPLVRMMIWVDVFISMLHKHF